MVSELEQSEQRSRAGVYSFFSSVLLREFDRETLEILRQDDWSDLLSNLEVEIPAVDENFIEDLAVDYCQIFVGPQGACVPCQSVWEDGQFESQVVSSMKEYLEVVTPESDCAIADHAGLQFELMARMLSFEASQASENVVLSESFFRTHVVWTKNMFGKAADIAKTDFYRGLLGAGKRFVESEISLHENNNTATA